MQTLRNQPLIARLMLGWFVLFVGVAVVSPMVHPVDLQIVCSASGQIRVFADAEDTAPAQGLHGLDCPACLTGMGPLPLLLPVVLSGLPPQHVPVSGSGLRQAGPILAASLPARGPPRFL